MDRKDYDQKIRALLDDTSYQAIKRNPTMKIERKVTEVLRSLEKKGKLPSDLRKKVQNQNSSTPQLYGLPKIHKASVPLRPIVSSINSPTYNLSRYLAGVLSPVWGKTSHDFVEKIRGMDVNTEDKLISFDVKSLFTKVPIDLSLQTIRRRLAQDPNLEQRTPLDVSTIADLTELCLRTTYFLYSDEFFEQKEGAAMGSPLSPVVANIFMEEFEIEALRAAVIRPKLWLRYVDDTFVIWNHGDKQLKDFLSFLIGRHGNIEFTMEKETNGSLPFLDVQVKKCMGSLDTFVFRKPTHTDRYLHFTSYHHPRVKTGIALCLKDRAEKICGPNSSSLEKEKEHLEGVLQANGYPKWEAHRLLNRRRQTKGSEDECKHKLFIPYIKGLSEMIDKSSRKMGIQTIFSKQRSLRTVLSNPKPPQPPMDIKGVVYLIPCSECSAVYIGETGRTLKVRLAEHKRAFRMGDVKNGIAVHSLKTGHSIAWDKAKITDRETHWQRRRVREAIRIQKSQVRMNLDQGIVLHQAWRRFNIHTSCFSHSAEGHMTGSGNGGKNPL